jgi:Cdc6-like AAA superfamily ATPase
MNETLDPKVLADMARLDAENRRKQAARPNDPLAAAAMVRESPTVRRLTDMIANAPESHPEPPPSPPKPRTVPNFPDRYREPWDRPSSPEWRDHFSKGLAVIKRKGILSLIGNRGSGKTRLAAEIARETLRRARYLTALDFFVEIKSTYGNAATRTELQVLTRYKEAGLLILDEIQERSENDWENRLLTNLLDARYSNERPTILIANLKPDDLIASLGTSISDRMNEGGGILQIVGKSNRGNGSH